MINLDAPVDVQLRKFWTWWIGELKAIVPSFLQGLIARTQELLVLETEEDRLLLIHREGEREHRLAEHSLETGRFPERSELIRQHPALQDTRVALRLSPTQGLRRQLKLPMAAEENLHQVIGLEMDRLTPFKRDQVYFAAQVRERIKASRQLGVELVLTPKASLDDLMDRLQQAGWLPALVYLSGESKPAELNLLPEQFKPKANKPLEYLHIGLASVAVAALILVLAMPAWLTRTEVLRVQSELKRASKAAKEVEAMREQAEKLLHQAQVLQLKKKAEPILVDALEELSRVIPDDTWLNGLQYGNRRVVIQGQSPSASLLLQQIEGSRFFKDVSFVSPVTKDAGNSLERFQIAFELINGRYSEEAR